jgi:hypothetical protein
MASCVVYSSAQGYQCQWNFAPQNQYDTGPSAATSGIATADFNEDGFLDVAVSNRNTDEVVIFAGDGSGQLSVLSSVDIGIESIPRYVVAGDFDGDGHIDIATSNWEAGADASYSGGSVTVALNDGTGTMKVTNELFFLRSACIEVDDVDNDGDPDLIAPHWDPNYGSSGPGITSILLNQGDATFEVIDVPIGNLPRGIDTGDLDGDGDIDFAVSNLGDNTVTLVENLGKGNFATVTNMPVGDGPRYLSIGDLNNDGLNDIAIVHKVDNELWILQNDGDMVFTEIGVYPTSDNPHSTTIEDINGDCKLDVIVSHVGENWVYIYENDGEANMVSTIEIPSLKGPAHVITSDLDGDDKPDILTADVNGGYVSVHLSQVDQTGCAQCHGDLSGNGMVDVADIIQLISDWGPCTDTCCPSDLNRDGSVEVNDIIEIISSWGACL